MGWINKPKIKADPDIIIFTKEESMDYKKWDNMVLRFLVHNRDREKVENCDVSAMVDLGEYMKSRDLLSWESEKSKEDWEKVIHFKGNKEEFVKEVFFQWQKWEKYRTLSKRSKIPEANVNTMLFVKGKDYGHLITRLNVYKIEFCIKPYTLILKFGADGHERKYELHLTSYADIERKKIDEIVKPIDC